MITEAKVILKELDGHKRTRTWLSFYDSHGIAVGNEYLLDMMPNGQKTTWRVEKILDVGKD